MSADPISDKELAALLRLAAAIIESSGENIEVVEDLDHAAALLDTRRGIEQ